MNNRHYFVFHGYLGTECEYALKAYRKMEETSAKLQEPWQLEELTREFWYSVKAFLVAYASISKTFYPPAPPREGKVSKFMVDERGEELIEILGSEVCSPFADRSIRDDFEHFDERLDEWFYLSKGHNLVDSSIVPDPLLSQFDPDDMLRNYALKDFIARKYVLRFKKKEIDIAKLVDKVTRLKKSLDEHQPNWTDGEYEPEVPKVDSVQNQGENPRT